MGDFCEHPTIIFRVFNKMLFCEQEVSDDTSSCASEPSDLKHRIISAVQTWLISRSSENLRENAFNVFVRVPFSSEAKDKHASSSSSYLAFDALEEHSSMNERHCKLLKVFNFVSTFLLFFSINHGLTRDVNPPSYQLTNDNYRRPGVRARPASRDPQSADPLSNRPCREHYHERFSRRKRILSYRVPIRIPFNY